MTALPRERIGLEHDMERSPMLQRHGRDPGDYETPHGEMRGEIYELPLKVRPILGRRKVIIDYDTSLFEVDSQERFTISDSGGRSLGRSKKVVSITTKTGLTSHTLADDEDVIVLTSSSTFNLTVTLPLAAQSEGREASFKIGNVALQITVQTPTTSSDLIEEAASTSFNGIFSSITAVCDGSDWWVI